MTIAAQLPALGADTHLTRPTEPHQPAHRRTSAHICICLLAPSVEAGLSGVPAGSPQVFGPSAAQGGSHPSAPLGADSRICSLIFISAVSGRQILDSRPISTGACLGEVRLLPETDLH